MERITKPKWTSFFVLSAIVLLPAFLLLGCRINKAKDSPNVIILIIDCLRADHVSSYGYHRNTTPNIDKFAKDSVTFTQAISQSTFTKTSMASLFTSRHPHRHGVYQGNLKDTKDNITSDVLDEKETTLAEVLLQNGFLTAAWLTQGQMASYMGFSQGFVEYNEDQGGVKGINNKFIEWAKGTGKKRKFFAYIHYIDLHDPYAPKPPYDTMYGVYNEDVYSGVDFKNWGNYLKEINAKRRKLEKKDVDQFRAYYDGQLTYIDSQVGVLLERLKEEGLYDNSLIILTSDHGDGFMEHGFISHTNIPYDELIRVPLIIKFPDSLYSGKVVKSQVRLIDIMPTVLDLLKIKIGSNVEGFSLLNYLDDDKNKGKEIDFPKYAYSEIGHDVRYPVVSVREEKFKYIHFPDKDDEFYDLGVDPQEQNNIRDLKPDDAEKFHEMALSAVIEGKKKKVKRVTMDEDTVEELKALGYIAD